MVKKSSMRLLLVSFLEKYWWVVVIIASFLTYVLIMFLARGQSMWFDEGYSIEIAKRPVLELLALTAVDAHPPFYYLLLKGWAGIFGWGEFALRSLSALLAAASIGGALVLIKRLFSTRVMLVTIPFVICAPFLLRYGYEVRMYALVGFIGAAATLVIEKAIRSTQKRWWVMYALLVALGMYTLYMSVVIWLAHLVWLVVCAKKAKRPILRQPWVFAYIGAVVLFIPYIPTLIHQLIHSALPGIGTVLNISGLSGVLSMAFSYLPNWHIGGVLSIALLTIVGLGTHLTLTILKSSPKNTHMGLYLLLICFFVPLIFYILISLLPKPIFIPRYLAHIMIYFYALLGVITALGWRYAGRVQVVLFGGLSLILLLTGVTQLQTTGNFNFERLQSPHTASLRQLVTCKDDAVIVADDPYTYIDSVYYFDGCDLRFFAKNNVDFAGGYAPLHDSTRRVADASSVNSAVLYHLHWVGDGQAFTPSDSYRLDYSATFDKQVVDRYVKK